MQYHINEKGKKITCGANFSITNWFIGINFVIGSVVYENYW